MVDLGFDIAVVLCGVNDGKKFWQGGRCRCSPRGYYIYINSTQKDVEHIGKYAITVLVGSSMFFGAILGVFV